LLFYLSIFVPLNSEKNSREKSSAHFLKRKKIVDKCDALPLKPIVLADLVDECKISNLKNSDRIKSDECLANEIPVLPTKSTVYWTNPIAEKLHQ
jgi:hypothetical protein